MNHAGGFGRLMSESGLSSAQRCMVESRDHLMMATTLNQNFGLKLLFSARTPRNQIYGRISVIVKSTREFLQWKYPSLPLATGLTRDRVPGEMV
jgi:hypothetical protein